MHNKLVIQMMERCAAEIKRLRRINAELAPKADAYDSLRTVLNLLPQRSQGVGEDLVWLLEKEIAKLSNLATTPVADEQTQEDQ